MSLLIREATEDDLPAVLALYAQPAMDNGKVLTPDEAQRVLAQFRQYPSYRLWVACELASDAANDGAVVGTYALLIMHNLAHQGTPSAIVEDVVVCAARQGQGIGQQMMQHAQQQARLAGCYKLVLSSNQKRERAHAFYESLGFQRHGFSFVIGI
ncbi:GNAT family N-acetyltransferase [Limnohabitans sp. G3-2]|uniref:GNAT family N-acetyltransferase n=1 Tax=Limnohabitans sp. G3-2 TaxID=1100711 RepID=UPI000C1EA928|nr:GNAT family N-acetyltransferase [Limnohabitans sp. G3-2]PIT75645.1 GNAT family N-acetyltransferase [Limnohabitans sp. G3-2]